MDCNRFQDFEQTGYSAIANPKVVTPIDQMVVYNNIIGIYYFSGYNITIILDIRT